MSTFFSPCQCQSQYYSKYITYFMLFMQMLKFPDIIFQIPESLGSLPGHRSSWQGTVINDSPWQVPWRQLRVAVFVPSPHVTEHEEYVQFDQRGFSSSEKWNSIRWKWIKSGEMILFFKTYFIICTDEGVYMNMG